MTQKKGKIKFGGKTYDWEYTPGSTSKTPMPKKIKLPKKTVNLPQMTTIDFLDNYFSDNQLREVISENSSPKRSKKNLVNYRRTQLLKILQDGGREPICITINFLVCFMDEEQFVNICKDEKIGTSGLSEELFPLFVNKTKKVSADLVCRFLSIFEDELSSELEKFENEEKGGKLNE